MHQYSGIHHELVFTQLILPKCKASRRSSNKKACINARIAAAESTLQQPEAMRVGTGGGIPHHIRSVSRWHFIYSELQQF
jgi:hypothetical protein